ncbi:hypothetical protein LF845_06355 [Deferribacterales bacterium Es71-Z0220]|uniref:hypothetical protein n=1 Tax=Deferrivibrio essentukiensis TaxID=2880922 RepID=UPI001F6092D0|nr:hypothetical protein [Deferrivibrio essentukiensis]MCB4204578.1 hypothetical protein [Deferrivibrio essentukiensis]
MNTINNINNLTLNLKNSDLNLKIGDKVAINVLKAISKDLFLINIKGKLLNAAFKSQPTLSRYFGEVASTEPFLEIKLLNQETESLNVLKKFLVNFDKNLIKNTLFKFDGNDLKSLNKEEFKKLIKNSGLNFEAKLLHDENIDDDLKTVAYKAGDAQTVDSITKLQVTTILNQALFYTFSAKDFDIKDGEIIFKKGEKSNSIYIKANFSELKDVVIFLTETKGTIFGTVKTSIDISSFVNALNLPGLKLKWEKLNDADVTKFDIFKSALSRIGNLQIYA